MQAALTSYSRCDIDSVSHVIDNLGCQLLVLFASFPLVYVRVYQFFTLSCSMDSEHDHQNLENVRVSQYFLLGYMNMMKLIYYM